MQEAMQWGVGLILLIQEYRNAELDVFFRGITHLGGMAHLYIVPLIVWSLSYRFGSRLLLTLLVSVFINFALKDLFAQPRPFEMDSRIGPDREFGYGIPSGHAQHTMVEWGLMAAWISNHWFMLCAVILIVLIGFSRIYLGVHYPTDVLAGWALAALILWLHLRYAEAVATRLVAQGLGVQLGASALVSVLFVLVYFLGIDDHFLVGVGGLFFGAGAGIALCHRFGCAPEGGAVWQRALRYVLGMAVLMIWVGKSPLLIPLPQESLYLVAIYTVNAIGTLWLTLGAPLLFHVLRLAPRPAARHA